ncbi:hypothetical protein [Cupriavidus taiwanensis]|uniref:hypothetical protein n=1 Tax=Cupriavidus taiwanensis TaxID=164546 RepID=UPI000E10AB91|nr:hypothetical protein [Cupriavidus taiwanensis]SOY56882.1 conserved hypothetical protein [Cupriavidus taiwanensis]SOY90829.1 conserved hypothetical protein [Cupriavidus taiwanensis]SOZ63627.1 conserved hypothetical protein [Cupriavidus taiwanensis]SOZ82635.1 conserved hypothetical protein [Cupriavidus taiwanensis]SOZ84467.1 conserved hypothetical protein [Cupriavidus taiwanensis]
MSKAKIVRDSDGLFYGIKFLCPGCTWDDGTPMTRILPVTWRPEGETQESPHSASKPHWSFNGDFDKPVFGPSVLSTYPRPEGQYTCHSFVGCNGAAPGQITFLGDSTHALAGQTVELPEIAES